jgi:hypothetical protein
MTVVAYVPDLIDRSKVAAAGDVVFVDDPRALVDAPGDVVVVDLMRPGVLEVLPALEGRRVIGFGRHTERAVLEAASAAGCGEVLARSSFFPHLDRLLGSG